MMDAPGPGDTDKLKLIVHTSCGVTQAYYRTRVEVAAGERVYADYGRRYWEESVERDSSDVHYKKVQRKRIREEACRDNDEDTEEDEAADDADDEEEEQEAETNTKKKLGSARNVLKTKQEDKSGKKGKATGKGKQSPSRGKPNKKKKKTEEPETVKRPARKVSMIEGHEVSLSLEGHGVTIWTDFLTPQECEKSIQLAKEFPLGAGGDVAEDEAFHWVFNDGEHAQPTLVHTVLVYAML